MTNTGDVANKLRKKLQEEALVEVEEKVPEKNLGGRPLKWETPELMQAEIDEYFKNTPADEVTITGLALALDTTRETLMDYQKRDRFADTVKKAKLRVQHEYEKDLRKKARPGDIFALKNFGWTDKREVTNTNINLNDALDQIEAAAQESRSTVYKDAEVTDVTYEREDTNESEGDLE